ncbi:hypothetical protein ABCS02_27870 [Microbacterium sp. X-17]|uniref:hypothetical protein n=1 Tax=Microbacterium sp. X-17 TaxID=3144404 RepID=UPI0031F5CC4B
MGAARAFGRSVEASLIASDRVVVAGRLILGTRRQEGVKPMRIGCSLAAVGAVAVLMAAGAGPGVAVADEGLTPDSVPPIVATNSGYVDQLEKLVGTQSEEEIEAIENLPGPVQLLVDSETGETLAAIPEQITLSRALTLVGPGCSTTSMCLKNSVPNGYQGTGSLSGSWKRVPQVATGDRAGTAAA